MRDGCTGCHSIIREAQMVTPDVSLLSESYVRGRAGWMVGSLAGWLAGWWVGGRAGWRAGGYPGNGSQPSPGPCPQEKGCHGCKRSHIFTCLHQRDETNFLLHYFHGSFSCKSSDESICVSVWQGEVQGDGVRGEGMGRFGGSGGEDRGRCASLLGGEGEEEEEEEEEVEDEDKGDGKEGEKEGDRRTI
ncbi:hypothetical protein E2C01_053402 [Portunus trituberculatus]|uniref:Uncharacterized protein n=1 Tax=Portunus trituberculatus TaxID=210409 RepID=A0A5B7GP86_PORTR|nr:hypothetical protein [Portunus trituberculatus]